LTALFFFTLRSIDLVKFGTMVSLCPESTLDLELDLPSQLFSGHAPKIYLIITLFRH